jgi:RHS repeat-associated protein
VSTYDAENHLAKSHPTVVTTVTDALTNQVSTTTEDDGTMTIGWGPNGHPALVAGNWVLHAPLPAMTLHWDGDLLLFVTDTAGNVLDFKVGLDGDVDPTNTAHPGPNAIERDPAGVAIEYANITDYSGLLATDPSFTIVTATGNTSFPGSVSPYFQYNRSDGLTGIALPVAINGVRAFDSTLGTWTTPDAYEGEVHDLASQQTYMWNRNNPYDYSDPSGYVTSIDPGPDASVIIDLARQRASRPKGPKDSKEPSPIRGANPLDFLRGLFEHHEIRPRPPGGSKPINKTEYRKYHREIKDFVNNQPDDTTMISPDHHVWVERGGQWVDMGDVTNMFHPSRK